MAQSNFCVLQQIDSAPAYGYTEVGDIIYAEILVLRLACNKAHHKIRLVAACFYAQILDGSQTVDGLRWWLIQCTIEPAQDTRRSLLPANQTKIRGWVAEKSPNGVSQLQRVEVPTLDSETIASILNPYELLGATQDLPQDLRTR